MNNNGIKVYHGDEKINYHAKKKFKNVEYAELVAPIHPSNIATFYVPTNTQHFDNRENFLKEFPTQSDYQILISNGKTMQLHINGIMAYNNIESILTKK
jgi:hypothetical protein